MASVLLAARCRVCDELLTNVSRLPVCDACLGRVRPLALPASCEQCQKPLSAAAVASEPGAEFPAQAPNSRGQAPALPDQDDYTQYNHTQWKPLCGACRAGETKVDRLRSFGSYDGELRQLIVLLKYQGVRALARPKGGWLALALNEHPALAEVDIVVPVPLYRSRRRQRGFNQAELLARALGRETGLPVETRGLERVKDTPPQTGFSAAQREENVRGAFEARIFLDGKRILLVDDVCTTGATLNACARTLQRAGAKGVHGLTVARVLQEI